MKSRLDCTVVPLQQIDTERQAFQKESGFFFKGIPDFCSSLVAHHIWPCLCFHVENKMWSRCAPKLERIEKPMNLPSPINQFCCRALVCFFGDLLRILPWDSSPFFTSIWGILVFFFPKNRRSKSKRSMVAKLVKMRSLPADCHCFGPSQQWGCCGTTGFTNTTAWRSILVKSLHGHFDPFSMWDVFGSL